MERTVIMMGDKEVKLIDTELLRTNIAQIAKACAKSDKQKALVGRILFMIDNMPTIEAEPVKHGRWEHGECSVCGASPLDHVSGDMYVEVDYYPNYCPSCGSQNVDLWVGDESVPNEDMRPDNEVM